MLLRRCTDNLAVLRLPLLAAVLMLSGCVSTGASSSSGSKAEGMTAADVPPQALTLFEQAAAICAQDDEIEALVEVCRRRYWDVVTPIQSTFQLAVQAEGWPPEGIRRLTQTFQRHVDGALDERRKTAYFMVDSLRYELSHLHRKVELQLETAYGAAAAMTGFKRSRADLIDAIHAHAPRIKAEAKIVNAMIETQPEQLD